MRTQHILVNLRCDNHVKLLTGCNNCILNRDNTKSKLRVLCSFFYCSVLSSHWVWWRDTLVQLIGPAYAQRSGTIWLDTLSHGSSFLLTHPHSQGMADVPSQLIIINDTLHRGAWDMDGTYIMNVTNEYPSYSIISLLSQLRGSELKKSFALSW